MRPSASQMAVGGSSRASPGQLPGFSALHGMGGLGSLEKAQTPSPRKTRSSKSCIRLQGVLGTVEKRCGHC